MATKIIINIMLIAGLAVFQTSFLGALPGTMSGLNLILVVLIFILGFSGLNLALWWAAGLGFALEIFSFMPFGAIMVSLALTVALSYLLLNRFFTNRSLYSFLAMTALATMIYQLMIKLAVFLRAGEILSGTAAKDFWLAAGGELGINLAAAFFIFYLLHFLGKNFKPVFLVKRS